MDAQLEVLHRIWSGRPYTDADGEVGVIGPPPHRAGGPEMLFGAFAPAAIECIGASVTGSSVPPRCRR